MEEIDRSDPFAVHAERERETALPALSPLAQHEMLLARLVEVLGLEPDSGDTLGNLVLERVARQGQRIADLEAEVERLRELNAVLRTGRGMLREERDLLSKENRAKTLELAEKTREVRSKLRADVRTLRAGTSSMDEAAAYDRVLTLLED